MAWFDKLNRVTLKRFGVPITYRARMAEVQTTAIPGESNAAQERLPSGYLSLQLQASSLGDIVPATGHTVVTSTLFGKPFVAEWAVVEINAQQEDWFRLIVQHLR